LGTAVLAEFPPTDSVAATRVVELAGILRPQHRTRSRCWAGPLVVVDGSAAGIGDVVGAASGASLLRTEFSNSRVRSAGVKQAVERNDLDPRQVRVVERMAQAAAPPAAYGDRCATLPGRGSRLFLEMLIIPVTDRPGARGHFIYQGTHGILVEDCSYRVTCGECARDTSHRGQACGSHGTGRKCRNG
jgi:hypothetical protein